MEIEISNKLAFWGLFLDLVGVLLIAFYGFPTTLIERKRIEWDFEGWDRILQRAFSWLGTALLILGFIVQIIGTLKFS